jgi:ribosomal protection tetracycline resistance protein
MTGRNDIRNVGILAHVDAGKTTVTEHMLYTSGRIRTVGSVDKGTAYTDFLDVERQRGISVRAASTSFSWKNININIIDTPGHIDFCAEVDRALMIMDCAVLVLSAAEGVQAQSEVLWNALRKMNIPTIIFINKIDRVGSNISKVLEEVKRVMSPSAIPLQAVSCEGTPEPEVITLLQDGNQDKQNDIIECLADYDDIMLEKYLNGQNISNSELEKEIVSLTSNGKIFPVLYGSAIKGIGIKELMDPHIRRQMLPHSSPGLSHRPISLRAPSKT